MKESWDIHRAVGISYDTSGNPRALGDNLTEKLELLKAQLKYQAME